MKQVLNPIALPEIDVPSLEDVPSFSTVEVITEARVTALFGGKGSGKSVLMAILLEGARQRHNRKVYYFPEEYKFHDGTPLTTTDLVSLSDKLKKAAVGVDEFQQVFNKYRSNTYANRTIAAWMQHVRKLEMELIITSNDPGQIDESFLEQATMHVYCKLIEDKRCKAFKYHLSDCKDTLYYRVIDTHKRHGQSPYHWDGRIRKTFRIRRIIRAYPLYNTFATVSNLEISALTKEVVEQAYEDSKMDMPYDMFVLMMRDNIIPTIVKAGTKIIYPQQFSELLAANTNLKGESDPIIADPKRIGRALKALGLQSKRGSAGNAWFLPDENDLDDWQSGMG